MSETLSRPTALVVDDEFLIAVELESTLQAAGFAVVTAITPAEAQAVIDQQHIDFAVIDFRMGDESVSLATGLDAKSIPFLFCTGSRPEEVSAIFPGATMIGKPFTEAELLQAVTTLTARR